MRLLPLSLTLLISIVAGGCATQGLDVIGSNEAKLVEPTASVTPVAANDPLVLGRERIEAGAVPYSLMVRDPARAAQALAEARPDLQFSAPAPAKSAATRSITTRGFAAATVASTPVTRPEPSLTQETLFDVVTVLWGTDRKVEAKEIAPALSQAGGEPIVTSSIASDSKITYAMPTAERGDKLTTGAAIITVPRVARAAGTVPRPRQYTVLNLRYYSEAENPEKHFTIASLRLLESTELASRANSLLDRSRRFKDQVLVFVHGYNTSFDDVLYRTAQIAHDLEFDGLAAMYSWPSRGTYVDYSYDLNSAARAQAYFIEFLGKLARDTRARRIHIVAHSMGNRPLIEALRAMQLSGDRFIRSKIGQVVFAAPDVDRDLFSEITAKLSFGAGRTLYASNQDKALILSRQADGVPRAGDVPSGGPVVIRGVDSIDISAASTKWLLSINHNSYAERSHILKDMQLLMEKGTRPPDVRFPLYAIAEAKDGRYWKYTPNK